MNLVNGLYWHPKILKAVTMLKGQASHNDIFTFHVLGLSYASHHLTDGFIPQEAVESLWKNRQSEVSPEQNGSKSGANLPQVIASVLSSRQVRLWHRRPGGWAIHDYLKHNLSAAELKSKKERERQRQRAWRARHTV